MKRATLRSVPAPSQELDVAGALRILLRDREQAERQIMDIDAQMLAYRKSYARERGEFMLPTLERLTRELLPDRSKSVDIPERKGGWR